MSIFDDLEGKQAKPAGAVKKRVNPFAQLEALEKQALQPKGPGKGVVRSVTDPFALGTTELIGSLGGATEAQGLIVQDNLQFDDAAKPKRELTTAEYDKMATPGISNVGFTKSTIPEDQPLTYQGGISTITGKPVAVEQGLAPKQYTDVPRESLSPVKRQVSQLAETVNPLAKSVGTAIAKGSRRVGEDLSSWSKETVENNPQWKLEPRLENVGVTDMLTSSDYSIGDKATKVFDTLMRQMPQQGTSLALTIGGAATGNAPLAYAGLSLSAAQNYALEMGGVYNDLKQAHPTMDEGELASTAAMHGVFAAVMETLPEYALVHSIPGLRKALLGEVTSKLTANKGLVKNVLTNAAKQGALEGSTESIQELSANTAKAVYDKNQELFVGMDDSAIIGTLMGIITGGLAGGFNTLSESSKPDVNKLNSEELLGLLGDYERRQELGLSVKDVQAAQKRAATREHLQGLGLTEIYDEEIIDPYGERSQTQLYNDPEARLKVEPLKRANIENITTLAIKNLSDEQLDFLKGNAEGLAKFGVSTNDIEYIKAIRDRDVLDASMYQSSLDNAPNEAVRKGIESYMKNRMYKQVMIDYAKRSVSDADYAKSKAKVEGSLKAIAAAKSLEDIDVLSMGADVVFKKHPELEEHRPAIDKAIADRQQAIENEEYGKTEAKAKVEATDETADEAADETEAKVKVKPKVETNEDVAKAEILKADTPIIQTDEDGSWHALADLTSDTKVPLNLSVDEKADLETIENKLKKAKDPEIRAKIQKQFNQALRPFIERAAKPSTDPTRKVAAKPFKRLTKKDYDNTYETLSDEYEAVPAENKGLKNALKESVTPEANFIKTAEAMRDAIEADRPDIATFLLQKYQDTRKGDKTAEEKLPTLKTLYKSLAGQSANNKVNIHDLVVFTDKLGKKRVGRITAEKGQFSDQGRVSTQIGSGEYHILDTDGNMHTIPGEELSLAKEQVSPKTTDMNQDDLDVTKVPPVVDPFNEQSTPRGYKKGQAYLNRKPTKLQQTLLDAIKDGTPVPDFETVDENGGKVTLVEVKGFGQVYRATIDGLLKRGLVARNEKTGLLEALDPDAKPTKVPVKNLAADAGLTKSQAEALDIIASGAEVASDESLQLSDGKTMVRPVTFNGLKKKGLIVVGKNGNWKLVNKPVAAVKAVAKKKVTPTQKVQKKAAKPKKGSEKVLSPIDILKAELEAELAAKAKAEAKAKAKKKVVTPKDKMDTLQRIKKKFPKLSPMQEKALKLLIKGGKITVRNRKGSMVKDGIGLSTMEALKKRGVVDQKKNNEWFVKPEWFMSTKELRDLEVDVDGDYEGTLFSKKEIDMRDSDDFDAAEEVQEKPKAYITIDNLQYLESMGDDVAVDELLDKVTKIVDGTTHDSYRVYDDVFVLRADTPQAATLLANKVKALLAKESVNFTSALGETHAYNGVEVTTTTDEASDATFQRPSTMVKTQARTGISAEKIIANLKAFLNVKKLPKFINILGTYDQIPQKVKDAFKLGSGQFQLAEMSDEDMRAELMQLDPNGSWGTANLTRGGLASAFAEYRHGKGVMLSKNQVVVGFYHDGKVYLIAEHINSTEEAISSLVHEGGHWMRQNDKVFQRKYNELLDSVLNGEGKSPLEISLLDKAWTAAEKERARFEKGTGSKAKAQALVEEEVLMYYLQDLVEKKGLTTKMTVWKKLKSMFQAWLYNTFGFTPKQLKWTDEDIARYFIRSIEKNAQEKVKFENKGGTTKEGIAPVGTTKASIQKPFVGSSRLEDGFIKAKGPKAADAKQWVTSLKSWMKKGMPNQVQEELFWSNLIEWLDDQTGTVTKKQVLEYLGENGLKSKIQVKTSSTLEGALTEADMEDPTKYNPYIENSGQRFIDHYEANGGNRVQSQLYRMMQETEPSYTGLRLKSLEEYVENLGRAEIRMRTVLRKAGANATEIDLISRFALELPADAKYQKDSLEYTREYIETELGELITFDDAVADAVIALQRAAAEHAAADTFINANSRKNQEYVPWENMQIDVPNVKEYFNIEIAMEGDEVYRSPHYDKTPNQLATARCSIITHEGEDLLFINEVQSDLHQLGKKVGYAPAQETAEEKQERLEKAKPDSSFMDKYKTSEAKAKFIDNYMLGVSGLDSQYRERQAENTFTLFVEKELVPVQDKEKVIAGLIEYSKQAQMEEAEFDKPAGLPFKTNSTTVALKEVIKAAVERGITKIAWCATPYQVKQIEGWSELTKTDKGWEAYGQSVTGSINQSVRNIPNALKKDVQKFAGGEFKTVTLDSNLIETGQHTESGEPISFSSRLMDIRVEKSNDGKFFVEGTFFDDAGYDRDYDIAFADGELNAPDFDEDWMPDINYDDYETVVTLGVPFDTAEEAKAAIAELKQDKTPEAMRQYNMFELSPELTEIAQQGDIPMASRKEEYDKARSDKLLAQIFDPNSLNLSYKDSLIRASSIASEKMGDPKERAIAKLTNRLFTKLDIEMPTRTKDTQTTNTFTRAFSLPEYTFFNRDESAKKAVQFALDAPEVQFETEHAILGETFHDTMGNMPKHEYKQVNDYLINTDRTGHAFSIDYKKGKWRLIEMSGRPSGQAFKEENDAVDALVKAEQEYLKKQGFTKSMLNMVRECRGLTNRGFDVVVADMRRQVSLAKENGLAEPTVGIKNKEGKREVIALSEAIARMGDLRGSYFPRERIGKTFNLVAQKESGKKVLIPISLALPSNTEDNVVKAELKKLINAHLPLAKEIKKLKAQGFTSDEIKLVNVKAPAEAVFDAPGLLTATDSVLEAAEDALDVGMTDVERKFLEKISQEMTFSIGNIYKSKGSFSSRMQRSEDIWEGYETDARIALASYAQKIAAGTARRVTARGMLESITGRDITFEEFQKTNPEATYKQYRSDCRRRAISAVDQKNLYTDIRLYMNHVLRPDSLTDRVVGYMKGLAVFKYLGGRVMSAAINVTNMGMAVPATIAAHTNISLAKAMAETTSAAAKYTKYRAQALEGENVLSASIKGVFAATELNATDKRIFDEIAKRGWDEAHFNQDSVRQLQSTPNKLWNTFMAHSMCMFGQTEKANRAMTIFAAYKALEKGSTFSVTSLDKAKHVSDRSHGIYGKAAKPWIVQKAKILDAPYTFFKFQHNYMLNMLELGLKYNKWGDAVYMLVAPAILSGVMASPAATGMLAICKVLGLGDDPEEEFYRWFEGNLETIARFGVVGLTGINLKGSLQFGNPIPDTSKGYLGLLGAPGAVVQDEIDAFVHAKHGRYIKAIEKALPSAVGSMFKGRREYNEGVTKADYSPVFSKGQRVKGTKYELALRVLGANPSRIAGIRERQWHADQVILKYQKKRSDIMSEYKQSVINAETGSPADLSDIMDDVLEYNKQVFAADPIYGLKPITAKSIQKTLKSAFKPTKQEMRY